MTKDLRNSCMVKIQMKMPSYYEDGKPAFQTMDKMRKKIDLEDWGVTLHLTEEAMKQTFLDSFEKGILNCVLNITVRIACIVNRDVAAAFTERLMSTFEKTTAFALGYGVVLAVSARSTTNSTDDQLNVADRNTLDVINAAAVVSQSAVFSTLSEAAKVFKSVFISS
jgi:hypothetical protein